jgi:NitT/TauT family transport system permease protein
MNSFAKPRMAEKFLWPILVTALLLAAWHLSVVWTATRVFPSPWSVENGLVELIHKHVLWNDIGDSLRRVALGFGLAAIIGVPLGLTLGWYPTINQVVNPVVQLLRPISPIAWIPVAIIFFGIGDKAAVFLIFLSAFFPIVVSCVSGVANVPPIFRRAARNFGLSPAQILASVIFPAALPQILIGLRLALGIAWLVVVAAEMIAVDSGW